ncbi:MAG: DMT family transporter [Aestuariivirga sp.]
MTNLSSEHRNFGLLVVLAATILWSTAGIFVRVIDLDVWTMLAWRSLFAALALVVVSYVQLGRRATGQLLMPGKSTLVLIPIAATNMAAYVVALKLTTVANVMIVYATAPLVAAALAFVILRQSTTRQVLVISLVALAGVIIMAGGAVRPTDMAGSAVAMVMTITMGLQVIIGKMRPGVEMAVVNAIAALICFVVGYALSPGIIPGWYDMLWLAAFGISNTALAYYFVLLGARYILPAEVGLIGIVDVILGPLWVWLLFAENAGTRAIIGGGVVLVAVCYYLFSQVRTQGQNP